MPTLEDIIADYVMDIKFKSPKLFGGYQYWLEDSCREYGAWSVYEYVLAHPEIPIREAIIHYIYMCERIMEQHPYLRVQYRAVKKAGLDILDIVDAMF